MALALVIEAKKHLKINVIKIKVFIYHLANDWVGYQKWTKAQKFQEFSELPNKFPKQMLKVKGIQKNFA